MCPPDIALLQITLFALFVASLSALRPGAPCVHNTNRKNLRMSIFVSNLIDSIQTLSLVYFVKELNAGPTGALTNESSRQSELIVLRLERAKNHQL
jgi:hypothetical protein